MSLLPFALASLHGLLLALVVLVLACLAACLLYRLMQPTRPRPTLGGRSTAYRPHRGRPEVGRD